MGRYKPENLMNTARKVSYIMQKIRWDYGYLAREADRKGRPLRTTDPPLWFKRRFDAMNNLIRSWTTNVAAANQYAYKLIDESLQLLKGGR